MMLYDKRKIVSILAAAQTEQNSSEMDMEI